MRQGRGFVDFFALLYRELEKNNKQELDYKEKEVLKHRKMDRNCPSWVARFLIYAGVIARAQP